MAGKEKTDTKIATHKILQCIDTFKKTPEYTFSAFTTCVIVVQTKPSL